MITLDGIYLSYDNEKTYILNNLSISINKGDFIAIVGESGAGKTSLINILSGILKPSKGKYVFNNTNIEKLSDGETARFRNQTVGVVFQNYNLLYDASVKTNILLPAYIKRRKTKQKEEVNLDATELYESLGITKLLDKYPTDLSGGEQQRVAFARAVINQPELLIADEPTGNLDERNTSKIFDLLKGFNESGMTVVVVTHDRQFANQFNRVYLLDKGKLKLQKKG
ncbi:MAG: ABC transporter ATP-binding protein [Bacilli bacterium]|nr:ABC transporter ATP-binding protein [Bacilli bacterium]MBN2877688.1 ABC transporter ATP-binding protein [Bacilli bacterium]